MIKLVFVDMDGTFLDSSKRITSRNAAALDAAWRLGIQFVPCTVTSQAYLTSYLIIRA